MNGQVCLPSRGEAPRFLINQWSANVFKHPHCTSSFLRCNFSSYRYSLPRGKHLLTFISVTHFQLHGSCRADVSAVLSPGSLTGSENSPVKSPRSQKGIMVCKACCSCNRQEHLTKNQFALRSFLQRSSIFLPEVFFSRKAFT